MAENAPIVHRDMFSPTPAGVARFDALAYGLIGEPAYEIVSGIKSGALTRHNIPDDLRYRANVHFNNALADRVNLPRGINPQAFWEARVEDAISVHQVAKTTFPSLGVDLLTEVATPDPDIADTVAVLAVKGHGDLAGHERKARTLMGIIAYQIAADDARVNMKGELVKVERVLLEHFFVDEDNTSPYKLRSHHDPETNSYVESPSAETTKRAFTYQVRDAVGVKGPVHYFSGLKPKESAIIKSIDRASRSDDGFVDPRKDVRDRYRIAIAAMDPIDANDAAGVIRKLLAQHYRPIETYDVDHRTDGYDETVEGNKLGWHREKIKFLGVPTPLELAVFDKESLVNYRVQIGRRDDSGIYDGNARLFYEAWRMRGFLGSVYTSQNKLYRVNPQDVIAKRMAELEPLIRSDGLSHERPFD